MRIPFLLRGFIFLIFLSLLALSCRDKNEQPVSPAPGLQLDAGGCELCIEVYYVTLTDLGAPDHNIKVNWGTLCECTAYAFYVQKVRIDDEIEDDFSDVPGSFTPGYGTTNETHHYQWIDDWGEGGEDPTGTWKYRIRKQNLDGSVKYYNSPELLPEITIQ